MNHLDRVVGGPRACLRVADPEDYRRWARRTRVAHGLPSELVVSPTPVVAHVSDGRWCVDCPCGGAALVDPDWGFGICADCGTEHPATFPADRAAVEAALLARPSPLQRHYFPDEATARRRGLAAAETLETLRAENAARGLEA